MKAIIAIDSFKGSLSSIDAGNAVANGIRRVYPDAVATVLPIADGGEGTVEALAAGLGGKLQSVEVSDPLGRTIKCEYCIADKLAVIEMAAASGLPLLAPNERNPLETTTYGVGQMIADAIANGCRDFVIGIGGSATNDGGCGMLAALGFGLYDESGNMIELGAKGLQKLARIDETTALPQLRDCRFRVACDVKNPLCGGSGCSAVFGPQKGATPKMVEDMDLWLSRFADLTKQNHPSSDASFPGCGAAGGLGFALREYLGGELISGVSLVLDVIGLDKLAPDVDILITGEGRMDAQTAMGKAPSGVAAIAKAYAKPCIAFAGSVTDDVGACNSVGIDAVFPIRRNICTLEEAMEPARASRELSDTAEQVFRLIRFCGQI